MYSSWRRSSDCFTESKMCFFNAKRHKTRHGEGDESIHLAAETMLIHVSHVVELGGRFQVHSQFHRFGDRRIQLYDV